MAERGSKFAGSYENAGNNPDDLNVTASTAAIIEQSTALTGQSDSAMIFNNIDSEFRSIAVVGLGHKGSTYHDLEALEVGMENARVAAAIGTRKLASEGCGSIHIDSMDNAECVAEGSYLANWRFQGNVTEEDRVGAPKLELYDAAEKDTWIRGSFKAHPQNLARDLCEKPSNPMTCCHGAEISVLIEIGQKFKY